MTDQKILSPFKPCDVVADSGDELAGQLAQDVAALLQESIDKHGKASLVVSGGSTPLAFLNKLSMIEIRWDKATVTLADERWVGTDHKDSNDKFVHTHLLRGPAAAARFVSMKNDAATPEQGWADCEAAMAAIGQPFNVVVLGMGGDGHTASLFPDTEALADAIAPGCGKLTWPVRPPVAPHPRMSLTLDALVASDTLILHITGTEKQAVYQSALTSEPSVYPIAAVIRSCPELRVYWAP